MAEPRRPEPENDFDRRHFEMIDEHGWAVMSVFGSDDDPGPNFAYTTGIFEKVGAPEVIVFGLPQEIGHWLCNEYGSRVRKGERFEEHVRYGSFVDGFDIEFRVVDMSRPEATDEYLRYSSWYYFDRPFPAVQLVWPAKNGAFPWEEAFPAEMIEHQPVLDTSGKSPDG